MEKFIRKAWSGVFIMNGGTSCLYLEWDMVKHCLQLFSLITYIYGRLKENEKEIHISEL